MKNPFILHFENNDEKQDFILSAADINSKRLKLYASFIGIFQLFLLIFDLINSDASYSGVISIYRIMNGSLALVSAIAVVLTVVFSKDLEKNAGSFYLCICLYSVLFLFDAILDGIVGVIANGHEDLTMFFISLMITSCIFHIDSRIIFIMSLLEYGIFEYTTFVIDKSIYHVYTPYPVFIILVTASVSFVRNKALLDTVRKTRLIKKYQQESEDENRKKSLFLANMSHEIRTPMNAIIGMSELALDFNLSDSEKNTIRQIRSSGMSLVDIINDILDFSKIESGKMELVPVNFNLFIMCSDILNVATVRTKGKDIELVLEIDPKLPSECFGDDVRLRQVLINLIGNAAKFTDKGFIILRVEKSGEVENGVRFNVIDSGIGIKDEDQKILFNAFQQVDMNMNRSKGGTGLGLAISKRLVSLMGGSIGLKSKYGSGTSFYFTIPLKPSSDIDIANKFKPLIDISKTNNYHNELKNISLTQINSPEYSSLFATKTDNINFSAPKAKILVVDDNDVNLQVANGLLKKFGIYPVNAQGGKEAINLCKETKFDVIFMDHQMPEIDGVECTKILRSTENKNKESVIIALSANAANGAKEMFLSHKFSDFVAKPVQSKDFSAALLKWLDSSLIEKTSEEEIEQETDCIPHNFPALDENKINFRAAVENAGSFDNWLSVTTLFAKQISKNSSTISEYLQQKDWKNYTIQVHALKSAARIIGAEKLSKMNAELEENGKKLQSQFFSDDSGSNEILLKTQEMLELYGEYNDILQVAVNYRDLQSNKADSQMQKEIIPKDKLDSILQSIRDAAENFDLQTAEESFNQLKKYNLPAELSEKMDMLQTAIENIEFDEIESILGSNQ